MAQIVSCETCGNFETSDLEIIPVSLVASAAKGCNACALLQNGISAHVAEFETAEKLQLIVDGSLFIYVRGQQGKLLQVIEFYTLEGMCLAVSFKKALRAGTWLHNINSGSNDTAGRPTLWSKLGPARDVSEDSSSDACIALAKRWLSGCLSSHSACKRNGIPILPSRVIEVGNNNDEIRLYLNQSNKRAEYAALSHCWGGSHPMILTKANLEKMQQSIIFDDSSKTFREAVGVTRRLGIPYLWIDSLCILQDKDDLSDWEKEAPKMSDIYNSATITISAASSVNTSGGLFPKIEDRRSRNEKIVLQITGPNGCSEPIHVRSRHKDLFSIKDVVHSSMQPEQPHLRSRGWVLQEDQLAPRMLQFRKEELAWICSTYSRCECRLRPSLPIPHPFRAAPGTIAKTPELTQALDLQWPAIVMEYSRRDLTRISDRIAALSGLANYMEHQTSDTYYCGLWYEDLAFQLLWYMDRNITTEPFSARFQFPYAQSWSWTSVPGVISYYERYPTGSAPSHPAIRTTDAVEPLIRVINVGRLPVDWGKLSGPVLMCPLFLVAHVLPVQFNVVTRQWDSLHPVDDFGSANLRVNIDVAEDLPCSCRKNIKTLFFRVNYLAFFLR